MITRDVKEKLSRTYPVLSKIEPELLSGPLSRASLTTLKSGTMIFDEFHPCEVFPFVLSGKLRVFKRSVNGRELSLYILSAGDVCIVTAGCLLGHAPYNACGLVKEDTELLMVPYGDFDRLLGAGAFREFIFSSISNRILELMQLVEEVAFQRLDRRLASWLIRQENPLHLSHQELADELGTVREIITRLLNSFSDAGLIWSERGRIEILDAPGLQEIAGS